MTCNKQVYGDENNYPSPENFCDTTSIGLCKPNYLKINLVCRLTVLCRQKLRLKN